MFSQVVLSMQLPFAVIPLVRFVSDRARWATFAISRGVAILAWVVAGVIVALNVKLLFDTLFGYVARMQRSAIRGRVEANQVSRISLRCIRATAANSILRLGRHFAGRIDAQPA